MAGEKLRDFNGVKTDDLSAMPIYQNMRQTASVTADKSTHSSITGVQQWWPQTMMATNNDGHSNDRHSNDGDKQTAINYDETKDINWWNLSNDAKRCMQF